ncbi:unnamed protein product [Rotaria sordida]|uniref:Methyltransferase type 11 domain-containing protein n=1 Tax=Rotaria sordida TaxID=392033 RepID=A0A815E355_9BILA|nr:unnamed protein product [Rotaria sordida]CAF1306061.1 unnamed protein product [Rotaria sordida]
MLPSGSPNNEAYEKLLESPIYKEWIEVFSNKFVNDNKNILASYNKLWVDDPLHSWSRGWEYTFVIAAIQKYAPRNKDLFILDVGSGVTFIDWMIIYEVIEDRPGSRLLAIDSHKSFGKLFHEINQRNMVLAKNGQYPNKYTIPKVHFAMYNIEDDIRLLNYSFDIAISVSVMEHVPNSTRAARNIFNSLAPGGYLIITFDIDKNNAIVQHSPSKADKMLSELRQMGKEIYFNSNVLRSYNDGPFQNNIEMKDDLYTLYEGKRRDFDKASWINRISEQARKGLFFSCHVFQKPQ